MDVFGLAISALIIFCAYIIRGVAGFGSGLFAVPLLSMSYPLVAVVPVVVLLDYLASAGNGVQDKEYVVWRDQLPLIPFTFLGVFLGSRLLTEASKPLLGTCLGVFLILYAAHQLLPVKKLQGSRLWAIPCGLLGGFIGSLFGTGGPLYIVYFNMRGITDQERKATFSMNFLIDGSIRLVAFISSNIMHLNLWYALIITAAVLVMAGGLYTGRRIDSSLERRTYENIISVFICITGAVLILKHSA